MLKVSCVLTGDKYSEKDVYRLKRNVEDNLTVPFEFVCLSDRLIPNVTTILLEENDWGVWNKLYLFKHLKETLYFDLDVYIQHNIDSLIKEDLTVIHCFWKPYWEDETHFGYNNTLKNSSIMSWKGDYSHIFEKFVEDENYNMVKFPGTDRFLDHHYSLDTYPSGVAFSRAHGTTLGRLPNDGNFFTYPEALVCLYNGKGKEIMMKDFE